MVRHSAHAGTCSLPRSAVVGVVLTLVTGSSRVVGAAWVDIRPERAANRSASKGAGLAGTSGATADEVPR